MKPVWGGELAAFGLYSLAAVFSLQGILRERGNAVPSILNQLSLLSIVDEHMKSAVCSDVAAFATELAAEQLDAEL
jgi:hypothetical protein